MIKIISYLAGLIYKKETTDETVKIKMLIGFSLKKLPNVNVNKIYEYDTMLYTDEELINSILADFDKIY